MRASEVIEPKTIEDVERARLSRDVWWDNLKLQIMAKSGILSRTWDGRRFVRTHYDIRRYHPIMEELLRGER